jgi:hypothetical protein
MNRGWLLAARILVTTVLLAGGLLTEPVLALPPDPPDGKAGHIVLSGLTSGWTSFRLQEPVQIGDHPTLFRGGGRVIAFVILPDPVPVEWHRAPFFYGASFGRCSDPGCKPRDGRSNLTFGNIRLPAGKYRMYLMTDRARALVDVRVYGLDENLKLEPSHKVNRIVRTLNPVVNDSFGRIAYSAGTTSPLAGRGIAFHSLWIDSSVSVAGVWGHCIYRRGDEVPDPPLTYLPFSPESCRNPDIEDSFATVGHTEGMRITTSGALSYLPKAIGSWYLSASDVEDSGAVAAWLKY